MNTDITRQISASVYTDVAIRDKIYSFIKEPYNALVESYGINSQELLKHICNARKREKNYYLFLFLPSLIFWSIFLYTASGEYVAESVILFGFAAFLIIVGLVFYRHSNTHSFLKNNLAKNKYTSNFEYPDDKTLIDQLHKREGKNVVIYSGYTPFVGSGVDIGGWSFVVDIDKGKREWDERMEPGTFDVDELYTAISSELNSLRIENLTVSDKVFINGKTIRDKKDILPDILHYPVDVMPDEYVKLVMNNDVKDARFYKVIQIVDWQGDLVLSDFLRLKKDEKSLFVESNYFLLPPVNEKFKQIDSTKEYSGLAHYIEVFVRNLLRAVVDSVASIFKIIGSLFQTVSNIFSSPEAAKRKEVKCSPDYDYGASTSIREALAQTEYTQHFQKLDKERYFKIIEKRIFNLIGDFLDSKNIDSSEFRDRESSILNQGVIVTGGTLNSQNMAVGKESKINTTKKTTANAK